MEDIITVVKGTELKLLFTAESDYPVDFTRDDFEITYSTSDTSKKTFKSNDTKDLIIGKEGNHTILIRLDTKDLEPGMLKCESTIYIEDEDFEVLEGSDDGKRKEINRTTTNIKIVK